MGRKKRSLDVKESSREIVNVVFCVFVFVCERESEREKEREIE